MSRPEQALDGLRTVADYQFGAGAGTALLPPTDAADIEIERTKSGRPRRIRVPTGRIGTYSTAGRFVLGVEGGRRLVRAFGRPRCRVVVGEESEPYVREGRNAFAKFVREVDNDVRPRDEVVVVTPDDRVLGVGRAELSATAMEDFDTGMAVKIRHGAGAEA